MKMEEKEAIQSPNLWGREEFRLLIMLIAISASYHHKGEMTFVVDCSTASKNKL